MVSMLCVVCAQRFQARFGVVVRGRQNLSVLDLYLDTSLVHGLLKNAVF